MSPRGRRQQDSAQSGEGGPFLLLMAGVTVAPRSVSAGWERCETPVFLTWVFPPFLLPCRMHISRGCEILLRIAVVCPAIELLAYGNFISCIFLSFLFFFPESEACQQSSPLLHASSHRWRLSSEKAPVRKRGYNSSPCLLSCVVNH